MVEKHQFPLMSVTTYVRQGSGPINRVFHPMMSASSVVPDYTQRQVKDGPLKVCAQNVKLGIIRHRDLDRTPVLRARLVLLDFTQHQDQGKP